MAPKTILLWFLLLFFAGIAIGLSFHFDTPVRESMAQLQGKGKVAKKAPLSRFMNFASKYGDWPELMAVGAVGFLITWKLKKREWMKIIAAAMIASTLAGIIANTSRLTTGRPRPRETATLGTQWYGPYHDGKLLIGNPSYNSFPSGHTATAIAFAAVFLFARPLFGIFLMIPALLIASSRMFLGAHHLSDVITSTVLALFIAWFVWQFIQKRKPLIGEDSLI
ncbi:MAG: phosphatase PAP2 family protein [Chthoniobacterales bacterium]